MADKLKLAKSFFNFILLNVFALLSSKPNFLPFNEKPWQGGPPTIILMSYFFAFSIMDNETAVIEQLKQNQGKKVTLEYEERYKTFFWWGDTRYFVTKVSLEK